MIFYINNKMPLIKTEISVIEHMSSNDTDDNPLIQNEISVIEHMSSNNTDDNPLIQNAILLIEPTSSNDTDDNPLIQNASLLIEPTSEVIEIVSPLIETTISLIEHESLLIDKTCIILKHKVIPIQYIYTMKKFNKITLNILKELLKKLEDIIPIEIAQKSFGKYQYVSKLHSVLKPIYDLFYNNKYISALMIKNYNVIRNRSKFNHDIPLLRITFSPESSISKLRGIIGKKSMIMDNIASSGTSFDLDGDRIFDINVASIRANTFVKDSEETLSYIICRSKNKVCCAISQMSDYIMSINLEDCILKLVDISPLHDNYNNKKYEFNYYDKLEYFYNNFYVKCIRCSKHICMSRIYSLFMNFSKKNKLLSVKKIKHHINEILAIKLENYKLNIGHGVISKTTSIIGRCRNIKCVLHNVPNINITINSLLNLTYIRSDNTKRDNDVHCVACNILHQVDIHNYTCRNCKTITCCVCRNIHIGRPCPGYYDAMELLDPDTRRLLEINGRACPSCHEIIIKNEGCDHITCHCGIHFCYRCGQRLMDGFDVDGIALAYRHHCPANLHGEVNAYYH